MIFDHFTRKATLKLIVHYLHHIFNQIKKRLFSTKKLFHYSCLDPEPLHLWLSDEPETHLAMADLFENPKVYSPLRITPVKTFKNAVLAGETEYLSADIISRE